MSYPTGTPVDELIVQDIVTTLEAIDAPTYHNTVLHVERYQALNEQQVYEFPVVLLGVPVITWSDSISPLLEGVLRMTLRAVVEDLETHQQSLAWIAADIRKALLADVTRSGNAVDTKVLSQEPFMVIDASGPVAAVDISIQVRFRHDYDDPNSAQ